MDGQDIYDKIMANILNSGQHIQGILSDGIEPTFCYTVGNYRKGLPELLLIGNFPPKQLAIILNILGDRMRETGVALDGKVKLEEGAPFAVLCRRAGEAVKDDYTLLVDNIAGHTDYEVVQVVLCDKNGKYPGDEGIDPLFDVPLV